MKFAKAALTVLSFSLAAWPAMAKDHGKEHGHGRDEATAAANNESEHGKHDAKAGISVHEREIIQTYVTTYSEPGKGKHKHHGLPPGLEKKVARGGQLPPGWEKKVVVGEIMPVEVCKEAKPLPKELVLKLPPPPVGTLTVTIDGKIVRLMEATKQILDVFELPLPGLSKR